MTSITIMYYVKGKLDSRHHGLQHPLICGPMHFLRIDLVEDVDVGITVRQYGRYPKKKRKWHNG